MATNNDTKQVINLKHNPKNMVYHIFQMHSDNDTIILHINTNSHCPINAVSMLINFIKDAAKFNGEGDEYVIGPASKCAFIQIPFVKIFLNENDILLYEREISYSDFKKIKKLILDYITTPEKALEVIDWMQNSDFDPYFIELIDSNSKFVKYITHNTESGTESGSESGSESGAESGAESD